jgi:hypothetical protein
MWWRPIGLVLGIFIMIAIPFVAVSAALSGDYFVAALLVMVGFLLLGLSRVENQKRRLEEKVRELENPRTRH